MVLLEINNDQTQNERFLQDPDCVNILNVYPGYYKMVGFNKPWIGYFASMDGRTIIGSCGFKGRPQGGKVEIAYGTFKHHEGKGFGTEMCRQLVLLASKADPSVRISARTISDSNASSAILRRNGFDCKGIVHDEEDGDVWEWEFVKSRLSPTPL